MTGQFGRADQATWLLQRELRAEAARRGMLLQAVLAATLVAIVLAVAFNVWVWFLA